ncbi:MAG: DNA polymerase III subunit gamma/tau [Cyanobacteria bacterium RUI128]|nr:DNA polymerase III subunit gamma/tau [Cyanobacteria bacterium RUI128]
MNEGYLPLYRKYRPQKLDDVVGQAHIKRALTNAIELNKISHAYLFTGPRGTGKTSTARILAKSLNCINGPTVTPCEECESCKAISATIPIDVIELDAASNRSVDDAREILEKVNYAPVNGKYKIYIIDEVHMLTDAAFNALLKTLEEPPKNVIFILATTESHKVMDTIKSRCQRFDFKRITTSDIVEHLRKIADKEKIKISDEALSVIAKSSAGGMRDSLALLDQVSTMGATDEITVDDINSLLGRISFDSLIELSSDIANSDGASAISHLEKIYNDGNEPIQILTNLLLFFKNILVLKTCMPDSVSVITGLTEEQIKAMAPLSGSLEKHQVLFVINKISDYIKELKQTTNQQMWLEVALIDLANLTDNTKLYDLEARLLRLEGGEVVLPERKIVDVPVITKPVQKPVPVVDDVVTVCENEPNQVENLLKEAKDEVITPEVKVEADTPSVKENNTTIPDISNLDALWLKILAEIPMNDGGGYAKMKACTKLVKCDNEGVIVSVKKPLPVSAFNLPEKKKILSDAICKVLGVSEIDLTVRERLPQDDTHKTNVVQLSKKKSVVPPINLIDEEDEIDVPDEEVSAEPVASENMTAPQLNVSDQKKMVMDLFEAKIIE